MKEVYEISVVDIFGEEYNFGLISELKDVEALEVFIAPFLEVYPDIADINIMVHEIAEDIFEAKKLFKDNFDEYKKEVGVFYDYEKDQRDQLEKRQIKALNVEEQLLLNFSDEALANKTDDKIKNVMAELGNL